jgi:chemotaxis protein MotB
MDANTPRSHLVLGSLLSVMALAGCVSRSDYDALQSQNRQLQQQLSAQSAELSASKGQVARLQGAIKYTVNSDLLFRPGGWQQSSLYSRAG